MAERPDAKRTRSKAGRLLLLHLLRTNGVLNYRGAQADVAKWMHVNRSTICRDMREIDRIMAIYQDLAARQPWMERPQTRVEPEG